MLAELAGPAGFGLAIFTMIFAANQLLNLGKLVSNDHAPVWAAIAVFLWELPAEIVSGDPDGAAAGHAARDAASLG